MHTRSFEHEPPLAIYYEHPEWFLPLFAGLERRGVAYDRLLAHEHAFDPAVRESPYALIVNRMSPSAFKRGHTQAIFGTLPYLAYLKEIGANVLNGYDAYVYEFSKARQLSLFERLGLRYPHARVINHPSQAWAAAEGLTFPVVIKPNIGGSGAGIVRFDTPADLRAAVDAGVVDLGIDHTALVQEYLPTKSCSIVRVEVLGGEFLYAIRIALPQDDFNLCPADYCRTPANRDGLADGVSGRGLPVEGYMPPAHVIADVQRLLAAANIEVGGVEYLVNARDGEVYYYDVNALSNFVANAPQVIGFDPFPRLVDYLLMRAGVSEPVAVG
ncbi:MAG TPA: hypothetical protein VKE41_02215 [Roseiflexaceae bacterium]|nr:hypothetical protein [Roseiflexaceae bacterium]